ncbi:MAG: HPr(Ser) kinase/phosphatase [Clostridia bacterium]|nr:HPr(Ser) kinase/phosphatase [Clostridia bacterium]
MKEIKLKELVRFTGAKLLSNCDGFNFNDTDITNDLVHRFGLELIGIKSKMGKGCILVMGNSEQYFLNTLLPSEKREVFEGIFSRKFAALFVTDGLKPDPAIFKFANKYCVPIFSVNDSAAPFISLLTNFLEEKLEPTITRPAGFLSIHGEGILLMGESGIGKSEVALELIHRGHKFISDDLTEIQKNSLNSLIGFSPSNISKFIEVRGVGIINVQHLFGVNAIKNFETIDMVVNFEIWNEDKTYERMGMSENYAKILGVEIPYISIPVKPGKNLAVIVEVAAMNNRLKKQGIDSYYELMSKVSNQKSSEMQERERKLIFTW